jgi:hypothetical protein
MKLGSNTDKQRQTDRQTNEGNTNETLIETNYRPWGATPHGRSQTKTGN